MARGARCSTRFYSMLLIEAGVEVREGFTVEEIRMEADSVYGIRSHAKKGSTVTEKSADWRKEVFIELYGKRARFLYAMRIGYLDARPI